MKLLSFNTQPPEGGCYARASSLAACAVSTHSRPKAAALVKDALQDSFDVSTHSRPKAAAPDEDIVIP